LAPLNYRQFYGVGKEEDKKIRKVQTPKPPPLRYPKKSRLVAGT
jgi:hypothetical protein